MYRRTLLIYLTTIVVPSFALLGLGIQSFERQRQALATLQREKVVAELDRRARDAARAALLNHGNEALVRFRFRIANGSVTEPALHAPPPESTPAAFLPAEREEFVNNRPDAALQEYRKLVHTKPDGLALARMARCLAKLGRAEESRAVWRQLASEHPDARDLAGRPYGIVAAIQAGSIAGLYDQIESGRWNLAADQAAYFLAQLDSNRSSGYLERFTFARLLNEHFRHEGTLKEDEVYRHAFDGYVVFYRAAQSGGISGIVVDNAWMDSASAQITREFGFSGNGEAGVYAAALLLVVAIVSAGVFLLLRDLSREARMNRLQSDLVSGVSHELKTPVTVIRLYAETLLRGTGDEGQRRDFYRIITRESGRLSLLIDRVLAFSRLERGAEIYRLEPGDPAPVIARTLDDYREFLDQGGFSLARDVPDTAPTIRFDATALSQAVISLLENAMKYSGEERQLEVRLASANDGVVVEVEDHGVGIAPSEQARIFERYYRVRNNNAKGGYGLGLYLVRRIMDAHGGRAEVESEPGRGSRFRLVFPVASV